MAYICPFLLKIWKFLKIHRTILGQIYYFPSAQWGRFIFNLKNNHPWNCLEIVQKDCYLISLIVFNKKVLPKILSFNQNFLWWPMGHIWYKMFISHLITFAIWKKIKTETIHWFFHNLCFNLIFSFPGTDYRQVGTTADL